MEPSRTRAELLPLRESLRLLVSLPALDEEATVEIAHSADHPSRVVLPVVPGIDVPTALPPCPSLRGQPCRAYQALANMPAS